MQGFLGEYDSLGQVVEAFRPVLAEVSAQAALVRTWAAVSVASRTALTITRANAPASPLPCPTTGGRPTVHSSSSSCRNPAPVTTTASKSSSRSALAPPCRAPAARGSLTRRVGRWTGATARACTRACSDCLTSVRLGPQPHGGWIPDDATRTIGRWAPRDGRKHGGSPALHVLTSTCGGPCMRALASVGRETRR